jgi:hypothetical protein
VPRQTRYGCELSQAVFAARPAWWGLANKFRTLIRPRESSGSNISHDTLPHHLEALNYTSPASPDPCSTPLNNQTREGGVRSSCEAHLTISHALSDLNSSAFVRSGSLPGRKGALMRPTWDQMIVSEPYVKLPWPRLYHRDPEASTINIAPSRLACRHHSSLQLESKPRILIETCYQQRHGVLSHRRFQQTHSQARHSRYVGHGCNTA